MDEQAQKTIDERMAKDKEAVLEELRRNSIIEVACKKTGVGRTTFYRWRKEDFDFYANVNEAIEQGRSVITDMAISQVVKSIQEGSFPASKFWLTHHDDHFRIRPINVYQTPNDTPELPQELIKEIDHLFEINERVNIAKAIESNPEQGSQAPSST